MLSSAVAVGMSLSNSAPFSRTVGQELFRILTDYSASDSECSLVAKSSCLFDSSDPRGPRTTISRCHFDDRGAFVATVYVRSGDVTSEVLDYASRVPVEFIFGLRRHGGC